MAEWEIKKTTGICSGTGEEIQIGDEFFAALIETEQGFERRDYSQSYWQQNQPQAFCFWKTKRCDPETKKKLFIDDDMLKSFFDRLEGENEPNKLNFRFVLALVLMRKRLLKYESSQIDGDNEVWTMKVTGEKRNVHVVHPDLTEQQIEELTENIGEIMQTDEQ